MRSKLTQDLCGDNAAADCAVITYKKGEHHFMM
jgi:hypothetical protein